MKRRRERSGLRVRRNLFEVLTSRVETPMTHPSDPNFPQSRISSDKTFVLGGLVALGVILAIFMFVGRDSATTTASNTPAATTGAGSTAPR
jgi:hypothetical protein